MTLTIAAVRSGASLARRYVGGIRRRRFGLTILAVSAVVLLYDVGVAVTQFAPWAHYGVWIAPSGRVIAVAPDGPAADARVRAGDQLQPRPRTALDAFQAAWIVPVGKTLTFRTPLATIDVRPRRRPIVQAVLLALETIAAGVFTAAATLLWMRRPSVMTFSLWLSAIGSCTVGDEQMPLLGLLPGPLAFGVWVALSGFAALAPNFAILPFALRFPDGRLSRRLRPVEIAAWAVTVAAVLGGWWLVASSVQSDGAYDRMIEAFTVFSQAGFLAVGTLIVRFSRMDRVRRAQTSWALVGFCGSLVLTEVVQGIDQFSISSASTTGSIAALLYNAASVLTILGFLMPLCAIYPILRYHLFDLGFVVNRATLYSALTLAAIGTLAGVNWLVLHVASQELALVVQPIAAIVIGLGYARVRAWTQRALERLFFHRRFRAEQHLNAVIGSLASDVGVDVIDAMLVRETAEILALRSAAVFRSAGDGLRRAAALGWDAADRAVIDPEMNPEALLCLDGLPAAPDEPVFAMPLLSAGALSGVVFYGCHRDGTDIDPEERHLLRRIAAAAAPAYEIGKLRAQLSLVERGVSTSP